MTERFKVQFQTGQLNTKRAIVSCACPVSRRVPVSALQRPFGSPGKWDNSRPGGTPETAKGSVGNWTVPPHIYIEGCRNQSKEAERAHISKLKRSSVFQCKVCAIYDKKLPDFNSGWEK